MDEKIGNILGRKALMGEPHTRLGCCEGLKETRIERHGKERESWRKSVLKSEEANVC